MPKNNHFTQANHSRYFFLRLSLLLSVVILLSGFSVNVFGQIAIPLSKLVENLPDHLPRNPANQYVMKATSDQLFVGGFNGAWSFSKDGKQVKKILSLEAAVHKIEEVDDWLLFASYDGLWFRSKDGKQVDKVKNIDGMVQDIKNNGEFLYVGTTTGLWSVSKQNIEATKIAGMNGSVKAIEVVGEYLFVGVTSQEKGLWVLSIDGKPIKKVIDETFDSMAVIDNKLFVCAESVVSQITRNVDGDMLDPLNLKNLHLLAISENGNKVEEIGRGTGSIDFIKVINKKLYVVKPSGLWVLSNDEITIDKFKNFNESPTSIEESGDNLFVGTSDGLWIVSKDGKQVSKVVDVKEKVTEIQLVSDNLFVGTPDGLWILNKDSKQAKKGQNENVSSFENIVNVGGYIYINSGGEIYRLEPKVAIESKLTPTGGLLAPIINWFLPSFLPTGKAQATAFYSDENEKKTLPEKFQFAKAESNGESSEWNEELSGIEIELGWNEIKYWVKDDFGNYLNTEKVRYFGFPSQYFVAVLPFLSVIFVLGCFALAPKVGFCHSAIMNPWLRKYFSLGSVPLVLSVFPSLRRYILRRYSNGINKVEEFTEWKTRFVSPDEEFLPENFGKKLNDERRLLLTGQSGIGKTSFFKYLTAYYASKDKPSLPAKVFPVFISLTNYGGNSLEDLVYNQLFAYGKITDKELAPMFLEQGGLLIFLDGVNEVQNVSDRQKLSEFVEKFWTSNYICLSSQQSYPEIENLPKVELKTLSAEKVCEFIRNRVNDKEKAEKVIESLTNKDYQLYSVPRDLEFAVAILNDGKDSLPKSRTELYKTVFSSIFAKWKENGRDAAEDYLYEHAYMMIATRNLAFDSTENSKLGEITTDLFHQKFLVQREKTYNFRHDLIRSYLASEYFYPRWQPLLVNMQGKMIDSNWLEMLKFSCENIEDSNEVKSLVYEILKRSIRKDLVKNLVIWLKANYPSKCKSWEKTFYAKYGERDFNPDSGDNNKMKKILFVMANPLDTTRLRLDKEFREVDNGLRISNLRDEFELKISTATRPNDLRREMLRYSPQFVHFSGHGETEGIVLEDENGNARIVETESLADLFSLFSDVTECVVLNSCFSENQAKAIRKHIPFVVGMNKAVPDIAAIEFAIGFYDAIGAGRNVEDAFKFGKNAIDLNSIQGKDIPVLMKKSKK